MRQHKTEAATNGETPLCVIICSVSDTALEVASS